MEQDNFEKIMAKIHQTKTDIKKQMVTTIADLKQEITATQEKTSSDISCKRWHACLTNLERRTITSFVLTPSCRPLLDQ